MTPNDRTETSEHRIVVGIDGSGSSLRALEWAAQQAELTGATLEVVITWQWPRSYGWTIPVPDDFDPAADAAATLSHAVDELKVAHPGITVTSKTVEGHPAQVLIDLSVGADLLVVGSRGHGEFAGMLLGSVSGHCVTNASCPVLILRDRN